MPYVERYYTPIQHAYQIVTSEVLDLDAEAVLLIAVKFINHSTGPDGLVPTLLVYGALHRLGFSRAKPTKSLFQPAVALKKATEQM